jgi:hypothetical protein
MRPWKGSSELEVIKRSKPPVPLSSWSLWQMVCSMFSRSGWSAVISASLAKGGTSKKRPSPHLHKVPTRSNKVSPRNFQTALVLSKCFGVHLEQEATTTQVIILFVLMFTYTKVTNRNEVPKKHSTPMNHIIKLWLEKQMGRDNLEDRGKKGMMITEMCCDSEKWIRIRQNAEPLLRRPWIVGFCNKRSLFFICVYAASVPQIKRHCFSCTSYTAPNEMGLWSWMTSI